MTSAVMLPVGVVGVVGWVVAVGGGVVALDCVGAAVGVDDWVLEPLPSFSPLPAGKSR